RDGGTVSTAAGGGSVAFDPNSSIPDLSGIDFNNIGDPGFNAIPEDNGFSDPGFDAIPDHNTVTGDEGFFGSGRPSGNSGPAPRPTPTVSAIDAAIAQLGQQQGTAQILPYRPGVDPEPVAWAGPAILTGEQPTATLLGFGITVPGDWRWIWHWHHNLPQEIFTPDFLKARGLKININSPRWGYMLQ